MNLVYCKWRIEMGIESEVTKMCKLGDIIVVNKYVGENGKEIGKHSFIVVDDTPDFIKGLSYTHVTTVISSFKNDNHKRKKLKYKENMEIQKFEKRGLEYQFNKPSYIKADKLFYFDKNKLDYYVFGRISDELLNELLQLILILDEKHKLELVTNNL